VVLLLVAVLVAAPSGATATTLPELPDGVNSILGPKPGQGSGPVDADDRGGANQLALFGVIVLAIGGIGLLVTRDVRRARARRAAS
jgi:hypothetical protein